MALCGRLFSGTPRLDKTWNLSFKPPSTKHRPDGFETSVSVDCRRVEVAEVRRLPQWDTNEPTAANIEHK